MPPLRASEPRGSSMSQSKTTLERLGACLAEGSFEVLTSADGMPSIAVEREALLDSLKSLRDEAGFQALTFITAVDRYGARQPEPRFEVVYQLHSIEHADRVRLRVRVGTDDARVPSCTSLWSGANYMERECYDLLGIHFDGHPDLRRLLMPEGYGHHPLRKEFPHQGIEPARLYREWDQARRKEWDAERQAAQPGSSAN